MKSCPWDKVKPGTSHVFRRQVKMNIKRGRITESEMLSIGQAECGLTIYH